MLIKKFTRYEDLKNDPCYETFPEFVKQHENGNYFQCCRYFRFIDDVSGFRPVLLIAINKNGKIAGTLMGTIQTFGKGIKSWMSRRLVVLGGPLVANSTPVIQEQVSAQLLKELRLFARGKAIYIEFRNLFDTSVFKKIFEKNHFEYSPHLNFLLETDTEEGVKKRMSRNKLKEIRTTIGAGAEIHEPESEEEIKEFYQILKVLYRDKIKKPLVGLDFFLKFWERDAGKFFLIKINNQITGGIICPVYEDKAIYEWYVCGKDNLGKGVYPGVLATWAPIEYGLKNKFNHFDFLGAGKPGDDYGVHEFKRRFGGKEVAYGRYNVVLHKPLYQLGKLGLAVYQKIR